MEEYSYRYQVSLRFRHPTEPLAHCTETLGLIPNVEHVIGMPRKTGRGNPLPGHYSTSYWCHAFDIPDGQDIEPYLLATVDGLTTHKSHFLDLTAAGGSAELFIGFFPESFNTGFILSPELLQKCAALGLALDFDVYGYTDAPGSAA